MSARDSIDFRGMDTLVGFLHNLSPRVTEYLTAEIIDVSNMVFAASQLQVPVRYGVLKASGHVNDPDIAAGNIEVLIGYGGPAAAYALFVHENMTAEHKAPTKAKYLEDPMAQALDELTARLQGRMEGAVMGEYPASPARGQQAEVVTDMGRAYGSRTPRSIRTNIARSPAMSADQVRSALKALQ